MSNKSKAADIDVGSIWGGVRRSLPAIMGITILSGVMTFMGLSFVAPRYEAETQLTITARSTNPYSASKNDPGAAATVTPRLDPAAINTHVRALMAPDLLLKVAHSLALETRPEFNSDIGPVDAIDGMLRLVGIGGPRPGETTETRVLDSMRKSLVVAAIRESRFLTVRFTSTDAEIAAKVANAIATEYRKSLREIPVRETNDAVAVLLPKIEQLSREVFEADAKAKRFRAQSDQLVGGTAALTLQQQRLATLSADLVSSEAELAKSEARLAAAREIAIGGGADALPEVQQSRVIQDLIAQRVRVERHVNEARALLLPAHPRMRQLNADLDGLRRSIRREIGTIVSSISKEVRLSQLRTGQLRGQIAELKKVAVSKASDEARLRALETTATSKRNELERLQKQLEDNRTVVDTNRVPVEAAIVSSARPDKNAVFPKKVSSALLVMAATLMLGIALTVARELLAAGGPVAHNRRASDKRTPKDKAASQQPAPATTGRNGIAVPPSGLAPRPQLPATIMANEAVGSDPELSELARRFMELAPADGGFRVLLTGERNSIDPGDEAVELATEFSDSGARVLVVDWTLSGQPLLADIDVGAAASLADLIADEAQFEDILVPLPDANIHYVFAGREPAGDELLQEDGLNLVLDALDEAYDYVLVVGRHDDAKALFETIEGRFDVGMTVGEVSLGAAPVSPESFLGFEVAEIEIAHYTRSVGPSGSFGAASGQQPGAEQRA